MSDYLDSQGHEEFVRRYNKNPCWVLALDDEVKTFQGAKHSVMDCTGIS